jgi:PcfJ-like protein
MPEEKSTRVVLLKDGKGVYGITGENLPEKWQHLKPIIIRQDRITECQKSSAALQMIPSRGLATSTESAFIEAKVQSWASDRAKKLGLDRLPPKHYFALRASCRRMVNTLVRQALAVANQAYLETARRYPIKARLPVYSGCCLYGERFNQIADTFPLAAAIISGVILVGTTEAEQAAKRAEISELVQKGARLNLIADALKFPTLARHVRPANVSLASWNLLYLNPQWLSFMPRTTHEQRRWLYTLRLLYRREWVGEWQEWVARHALELRDPRPIISAKLNDLGDWLHACRDKANETELERLNTDVEILIKKARDLGKDTSRIQTYFTPHSGAKFVTRLFAPDMSIRTVQRLCDEWHEAVSMSKFSRQETEFPPPWYPHGEIKGYTITPIRTPLELFHEGRAMHNCSLTYADRIANGNCFFYSVTKDGEHVATLMITHRDGQTVLGDLRGVWNDGPDRRVKAAVQKWLVLNQQLHGNGNRPQERLLISNEEFEFFQGLLR